MKFSLKWVMMLPLIASLFFAGCTKEEDDPAPAPASPVKDKVIVFEGHSHDAEVDVKVYADEALFNGYNRLYVLVYEEGTTKLIKDAHVSFHPEMSMMGGMTHSAPVEDPATATPADGLFSGAVVFVMPSMGGTWNLEVHVHNHSNNLEGHVESEVVVAESAEKRLYSFVSPSDSMSYFVSLVSPMKPEVGNNDFEIAIHKRESEMSWPIATGLKVEIEPEMPSMGHGSTGNVNPTYTTLGHYGNGVVNFTMTGMWNVNMTIKDGSDNILDDANYFEIEF